MDHQNSTAGVWQVDPAAIKAPSSTTPAPSESSSEGPDPKLGSSPSVDGTFYDCELCGQAFPSKSKRSKHIKTEHCFKCETCGRTGLQTRAGKIFSLFALKHAMHYITCNGKLIDIYDH